MRIVAAHPDFDFVVFQIGNEFAGFKERFFRETAAGCCDKHFALLARGFWVKETPVWNQPLPQKMPAGTPGENRGFGEKAAFAQTERTAFPCLSIYPGYDGSARPMGSNHSPGSVFAKDFSFFAVRAVDTQDGRARE
jgi:hypothetical protein